MRNCDRPFVTFFLKESLTVITQLSGVTVARNRITHFLIVFRTVRWMVSREPYMVVHISCRYYRFLYPMNGEECHRLLHYRNLRFATLQNTQNSLLRTLQLLLCNETCPASEQMSTFHYTNLSLIRSTCPANWVQISVR